MGQKESRTPNNINSKFGVYLPMRTDDIALETTEQMEEVFVYKLFKAGNVITKI